jgi:hypothetical protein
MNNYVEKIVGDGTDTNPSKGLLYAQENRTVEKVNDKVDFPT